jgi:superfamily I DNA/RNA helicase
MVPSVAIRHLINEDGEPFTDADLDALAKELDALSPAERKKFRDENANAIAQHIAEQILIVAGPGTGKSTIFKQRVLFWLARDTTARILALSFVRKLVADLNADIQNDEKLTEEQKSQIDIFTLHKYARSVVEQNRGTREWKFAPHFRIIGQDWKSIVWRDALSLSGQKGDNRYSWEAFEKQLHDDDFDESDEWKRLKKTYFALCQFYNAAGFSDLILRARDALAENPNLNQHHFFIVDEFQDFNISEEELLDQITQATKGKLIVGDDDQVLYETLKSGKASLIRGLYRDTGIINAMLAFCGRCDFHITHAASHFIKQAADPNSIKKIYLPMEEAGSSLKVQIVACAQPSTAVDYIRKFIEDHTDEIEQRRNDLASGDAKDAFLLILSPSRAVDFYKLHDARDQLLDLVKPYREERREFSHDYYKVLNYYSLANYPSNNFTFRKVLHYEETRDEELLALLKTCMTEHKSFSAMDSDIIRKALAHAKAVRDIVESKITIDEKVQALAKHIQIADPKLLRGDLEWDRIDKEQVDAIEHQEEEAAELEELEVRQMCAVELMPIVGSKGLSADHVIIIGCDNVNMGRVTRNAFFVAMTRGRKSLHIITALKSGGAARLHDFVAQLPDANLEFSRYTKGTRTQEIFGARQKLIGYLQYLSDQSRRR